MPADRTGRKRVFLGVMCSTDTAMQRGRMFYFSIMLYDGGKYRVWSTLDMT